MFVCLHMIRNNVALADKIYTCSSREILIYILCIKWFSRPPAAFTHNVPYTSIFNNNTRARSYFRVSFGTNKHTKARTCFLYRYMYIYIVYSRCVSVYIKWPKVNGLHIWILLISTSAICNAFVCIFYSVLLLSRYFFE